MKLEEVTKYLQSACDRFLDSEGYLLENNVNERSLTHKFAEHLQNIFGDEWNVDCEYNRFGADTKAIDEVIQIVGEKTTTYETKTKTIYPDIIVHKRGPNGPNLVVLEAKKDATPTERKEDIEKLIRIKELYSYKYAVFVNFELNRSEVTFGFV